MPPTSSPFLVTKAVPLSLYFFIVRYPLSAQGSEENFSIVLVYAPTTF